MRRPASLAAFFVTGIVGYLLLTLGWMQVAHWTSYPVSGITHILLGNGAGEWIRSIEKAPGKFDVDTRIAIDVPGHAAQGRAELVVEGDPARYAYGLPLFIALLVASRSRHFLWKVGAGYVLLLFPQAFSLSFDVLRQIIVAGGTPTNLGIAQWQLEGIALGYQVGALLLPTVAPAILWLFFEHQFFAAVIVDGMLRRELDMDQRQSN
jgi:hypothetical protein